MSAKGKRVSKRCFICTDTDIIEMEGAGFINFENVKDAEKYLKKLEGMIEWER